MTEEDLPFRHMVVKNFLGKVRAELFLETPPAADSQISIDFGLPEAGWSQLVIHFVGAGHFVCIFSDTSNDFYSDLAIGLAKKEPFSVAAHMEPDTFALYFENEYLYVSVLGSLDEFDKIKSDLKKIKDNGFISIGVPSSYLIHCLKNLSEKWPKNTNEWAHRFPYDVVSKLNS